jgi:hypothetical protein
VDALSPRDKAAFLAFYGNDATVADLAVAHGLAPQIVRGTLSRAKKAVLARMGLGHITNAQTKALAAFTAPEATPIPPAVPTAADR